MPERTLAQLAPCLKGFDTTALKRVWFDVLGHAAWDSNQPLSDAECLLLTLGEWGRTYGNLPPMASHALLRGIWPILQEFVQQPGWSELPLAVGVADRRYATWPGSHTFLDLHVLARLEKLPESPVQTHMVDVVALYRCLTRALDQQGCHA